MQNFLINNPFDSICLAMRFGILTCPNAVTTIVILSFIQPYQSSRFIEPFYETLQLATLCNLGVHTCCCKLLSSVHLVVTHLFIIKCDLDLRHHKREYPEILRPILSSHVRRSLALLVHGKKLSIKGTERLAWSHNVYSLIGKGCTI